MGCLQDLRHLGTVLPEGATVILRLTTCVTQARQFHPATPAPSPYLVVEQKPIILISVTTGFITICISSRCSSACQTPIPPPPPGCFSLPTIRDQTPPTCPSPIPFLQHTPCSCSPFQKPACYSTGGACNLTAPRFVGWRTNKAGRGKHAAGRGQPLQCMLGGVKLKGSGVGVEEKEGRRGAERLPVNIKPKGCE